MPSAPVPALPLPARPLRVLVVDDDPVNRMLISARVVRHGLAAVQAEDGAQAVALALGLHLGLILMDLQMPVLDGLAAAAAIRRSEQALARPAVPLIAYSSAPVSMAVLAAHGLQGSLAKPATDQDLEDCLRRWCPAYHHHRQVVPVQESLPLEPPVTGQAQPGPGAAPASRCWGLAAAATPAPPPS